jgi:hypothetical protein
MGVHSRHAGPATPFDFLVGGEFLRTSLEDYLLQNGLSKAGAMALAHVGQKATTAEGAPSPAPPPAPSLISAPPPGPNLAGIAAGG